jgi:adenosylcobinamide-GDP ribazoletransferase
MSAAVSLLHRPLVFVRHYLLAVQFFTRVPVTGRLADWVGYSPAMLRASAAHFPGVGWLVGALTAAMFWLALQALPALPSSLWVAALASTAFSLLLTGAFHEDGLADTADGLGGGFTRERALEIMKDSRIGTYGAAALGMALTSKLALLVLLAEYSPSLAVWALFAAHVTSRLMPLFLIRYLPHVGDTLGATSPSKSKPLAETIGVAGLFAGCLWWALAMVLVMVLVTQAAPPCAWGAAVAGAAIGMLLVGWRLRKRLQGFTGDGLGAAQQLAEIGFYLGLALSLGGGGR